ncbi:MAG: hypothetical protein EHM72_03165 [Calditrichaeota bacterium]|nr:MAG: hypothetical protein EHM72_03165 [Calditrichota bacterium]
MRQIFFILLLIGLPLSLFAQFKSQAKSREFTERMADNVGQAVGFLGLDPSRFSMTQSYSMSYLSSGGKGFTQGVYLNTLQYQFSIPLTLTLQVGMAHQPFGGTGASPMLKDGIFVSGAQASFRPTQNTLVQFEYSRRPLSTFSGYSPFYSGWGWREW